MNCNFMGFTLFRKEYSVTYVLNLYLGDNPGADNGHFAKIDAGGQ